MTSRRFLLGLLAAAQKAGKPILARTSTGETEPEALSALIDKAV